MHLHYGLGVVGLEWAERARRFGWDLCLRHPTGIGRCGIGWAMGDRTDELWMRQALAEAYRAQEEGEVPVGAIIARGGTVVGRGHNQREMLKDPTAHAEMIAITAAAEAVGSWRLTGCVLYVTLEPCLMCAGAIVQARLDRVVFGAEDRKAGACVSLYQAVTDERLNHRVSLMGGVLAAECGELLSGFFQSQRALGKK